jgi:hypothetical protein
LCFDLTVPIKASSAQHVESLIHALGSDQPDQRDGATARLIVIGARALDRVLGVVESGAAPVARIAALRVLEATGDPRAVDHVLAALNSGEGGVARAAAVASRSFLRGARGAAVVDRLTAIALDDGREESLRVAALEVLRELEPTTIAPLVQRLAGSPRAILAAIEGPAAITAADRIIRAADEGLGDDPIDLAEAVTGAGGLVGVPVLLRLIERVREREPGERLATRAAWVVVRGRAHVELARRGSRIALYDLRETLERATAPLPVDFLAALSMAGDGSCLEALAGAYDRASSEEEDTWWRDHLADAFQAIVAREGMTRRHSVSKRIEKRLKRAADELWAGRSGERGRRPR